MPEGRGHGNKARRARREVGRDESMEHPSTSSGQVGHGAEGPSEIVLTQFHGVNMGHRSHLPSTSLGHYASLSFVVRGQGTLGHGNKARDR